MIELWQRMADLTMGVCRKRCHNLGSCCEPMYCEMARQYAEQEHGVVLEDTGDRVPFLGPDRKCIVPPHLRPLCTVHQCDINGAGLFKGDPELTAEYFHLREQLDEYV